jgi:predicted CopG family antitoxin
MGKTNISVSDEVADYLYEAKDRGESYDEVLRALLGMEADQ